MSTFDRIKVATRLSESKYLKEMAEKYAFAPSAILIRTAEAELLSAIEMKPPVLDLCCGDGYFCSLVCPGGVEAGCDMNAHAVEQAQLRGQYQVVECADVARNIPFRDEYFQTIISNSSLEHVKDVDVTLQEVTRVLKPGGRLCTTFASNLAYEWWPCGQNSLKRYVRFQPVYHYLSLEGWKQHMKTAGLQIIDHQYYLSKGATRMLMFLDYHFSHVYCTDDRTLTRPFIRLMRILPSQVWATIWRTLFSRVRIMVNGGGGGILIITEKRAPL